MQILTVSCTKEQVKNGREKEEIGGLDTHFRGKPGTLIDAVGSLDEESQYGET